MAPLLVAGCYSSYVAPDTVEKANDHLRRVEKTDEKTTSEEDRRRLVHLFADRPEYIALAERKEEGATLPRLRVSVPPKYPLGALLANTKALVKVAFVVSETGDVEEARLFEASDARFSDAALEAVRAWKFYPGEFSGHAAKFLMIVPVQFDGRK